MGKVDLRFDEAAIMARFDRTSPESLLKTMAAEFVELHRMQSRLAAQFAAVEYALAAIDRIAAEGKVVPTAAVSTVTINATDACEAAVGFYELEHDSNGGGFRWSGPDKRFSFKFLIDRRVTARFVLRFDGLFGETPVEQLLCYVDGEKSELTIHRFATGYEASGFIPARCDSCGAVLTFECPAMGSPLLRGSPDTRQLGLQFRRLSVRAEDGLEQTLLGPPANPDALSAALMLSAANDPFSEPLRGRLRTDDNTVVFIPMAEVKTSLRQRP